MISKLWCCCKWVRTNLFTLLWEKNQKIIVRMDDCPDGWLSSSQMGVVVNLRRRKLEQFYIRYLILVTMLSLSENITILKYCINPFLSLKHYSDFNDWGWVALGFWQFAKCKDTLCPCIPPLSMRGGKSVGYPGTYPYMYKVKHKQHRFNCPSSKLWWFIWG